MAKGFRRSEAATYALLLLLKLTLAGAGMAAALRNFRLLSKPPVAASETGSAASKRMSSLLADRWWLVAYLLMNLVDETKTLYVGGGASEHLHHIVTALGFACNAYFGSARTMALARVTLLGEAVAPFYQTHKLLQVLGWEQGKLARLNVVGSVLVTLAVRLPLEAWCVGIAVRDCDLKLRAKSDVDRGVVERRRRGDADPLVSLESVQPALLIPAAMGSLFMACLDLNWLVCWSLPLLRRGK